MTTPEQPARRVRPGLLVALAAVVVLVCCGGGLTAFLLDGLTRDPADRGFGYGCGRSGPVDPNAALPRTSSLSDDQMHNAAVIIATGQRMNVPPRGWVVAVATALQESSLVNLPNLGTRNDHDSLGLFQQRPSQGWGTPGQLLDPEYASRKFYEKLVAIRGWQTMSLTDAAQTVQRSAYPDAYAKHEPLAARVVNLLTDGAARAVGSLVGGLRCAAPGEMSASGWVVPLRGALVSGFRTAERPTHQGVDIAVPKGTVVHAAAAGVVITARCSAIAPGGGAWGCDRDGSTAVQGCGWYVNILHADNVITRYCHMVARPDVVEGQLVAAGQPIGRSGSSGNSSGPHLHFEVHLNGDGTATGAVSPIQYMRDVGAPLGEGQQ